MDLSEIKKLLELMDQNKVVELEFEEGDKKIRLRRADASVPHAVAAPVPVAVHVPVQVAAAPAPVAGASAPGGPAKRADNLTEIKSPLVGTFYRSSKPDADPFVNVGDEVNPEKVLCIIEAMKVMNEIKAEMSGIVREAHVKNGQAVEFGEVLFLIEKK